ncbi:hypothetical protein HNQ35_000032 [Cerasibacillus quisquiliarum]|uniref:Uncharacterized protein n=1 Tax=Cerasibacillus quisquiliarum TaxID=227865 RepID=A0A511UUM4_9BACI|nr:replicative helicase loader/inhibitor [Cerasibacillus quisquiliarum]MBB5144843.1 hypothetical protein [Cerasibacillus quisquiliarum]GEN30264.1 hypothetical protein CQU01_05020 [Cerasibacillus quisquiliarum]
MNREQVKQLFKFLVSIYPNFEVSSHKLDVWTRMMKDMDFNRVMAKAETYVTENRFPPTIADLSAYAPDENKHLEQMKQWKREAQQVPDEVKHRFRQQLLQLVQVKRQ